MRRFELVAGSSSKFWEVEVDGADVVVRYGRIGTDGQTRRKAHRDAAQAATAADKLVREKVAKGYLEVGGLGAAPSKAATPTAATPVEASPKKVKRAPKPAAASAPVRAATIALVPRREPTVPARGTVPRAVGFAFTTELDELWARGFPKLFVLREGSKDAADTKLVKKALADVDPVLPVFVSSRAASRFLRAYACGKTWRWSNEARGAVYDPVKVAAVDAALASDEVADLSVLDSILEQQLPHGDETYPWRVQQAVWLAEALHGTEPVLARVVDHLARVSRSKEPWGVRGDPGRTNNHANVLAAGLAGMRLRLPQDRWHSLVAPLRGITDPALEAHGSILEALFDDQHVPPREMTLPFAIARRDSETLASFVRKAPFPYWPEEIPYVLGVEWLATAPGRDLKRHPKWKQLRLVDELGTIDHEEVARVIAWIGSGSSARKPAFAWLTAHPDLARAAAARMLATAGEKDLGRLVMALLDGEPLPKVVPLTKARHKAAIAELFGGLAAAMAGCQSDTERERLVMQDAYDRYCDLNAAIGDITPEAYFTHHLGVFGDADEATRSRWIDLGVEVASR
ncbi:MAG: WGR domain-containing protein [Myxococcales bacterium]|nr:WGR domain-containing protein [Myxococcales bacterium]